LRALASDAIFWSLESRAEQSADFVHQAYGELEPAGGNELPAVRESQFGA